MKKQGISKTITPEILLSKGYTMRAAAKAIKRSAPHVYYVLTGKRISPPTLDALKALPPRTLTLRRQIEVTTTK